MSTTSLSQRVAFWILLFLTVLGLAWSGFSISNYWSYTQSVTGSARSNLASQTQQAAGSIDAVLREAMKGVDSVAAGLSDGTLSKNTALDRLRDGLEQHADFLGSTVSYKPYAFDPGRRLYSAYFAKKDGRIEYFQLDTIYDYTKPEYDWFGPAVTGGPLWTKPYYDEAARTSMVTYSAPFFEIDPATKLRRAKGVVTLDISMDGVRKIVQSLDLGAAGFGALVSKDGAYLAHPDAEMVQAKKTLAQLGAEQNDPSQLLLAKKVANGETGILEQRSLATGLDSWLSYACIPASGWSLQNTFVKDDLPWDVTRIKRQLIQIIIALLLVAGCVIALALRAYRGGRPSLWATSVAVAVLFGIGIGCIWNVSLAYDSRASSEGIQISDKATLHQVMNSYTSSSAQRHTEAPVYIPTGIYIESVSFGSSNDVTVSGYVWQKYAIGAQDALSRGFVISAATSLTLSEPYRVREHNTEIVRWQFSSTIRQRLDHFKYPLDQATISLRLLHRDLNRNVVLIPDLAAYNAINSTSLPGLSKALFLPGWKLTRSFFDLRNRDNATNFGLERSLSQEDFPALHFNIGIQRVFVDALISNLTAVIIITILLFILLMLGSQDERLVSYMHVGSGGVLNICVAMFFIIGLNHIDVRRQIAAEEMFYLEYFYFLIYVTMLWVALNSVLFAIGKKILLIQYRDNLVSKLAFWPCLLGFLFIVTVLVFH